KTGIKNKHTIEFTNNTTHPRKRKKHLLGGGFVTSSGLFSRFGDGRKHYAPIHLSVKSDSREPPHHQT
ncbi:MAG: hypothetical protein Q4C87_06310, partial [Actinomycetaceae bacterium]|nr:hypothetical protein [Actinomycetaceae bacterium]